MLSGWKAFGILLLTSAFTIGWLEYSLLSAEKIIAVQESEIIQYKNNSAKLEEAVTIEKKTVQTLLKLNESSGERLHELTTKQQQVFADNAKLNEEINSLRQSEATLALENPYARGNAAGTRINNLMQSISGSTTSSTKSGNLHDTNTTKD